ncbi:interferon-induced GTP-binding protein Mx-like [Eucyclogobius newberryi]|uniref:interferon-induced GTP-binding protein Mx-like n=1 Tax=Eucyclogobius newberryi TaxID=166745 RepID=UPI003B5A2311
MEHSRTDKMRTCIDLIDSLRSLGVEQDLALPAIAVIGDQSSGKSSVLEALSGVALPRGMKYNLQLKMNKTKGNEWKGIIKYKAMYSSLFTEKIIRHPKDVAETINKGKVWDYSDCILEILSPDVPDLTLIALPSIPSEGKNVDQFKMKNHINEIIRNPECMILVVVPCNVDIATSEALKMAQEVDPDKQRTLGLLTKPDLVEKVKEKDIVDMVKGHGFMIVRCFDQTKTLVMDPIEQERNFFKDHAHFNSFYDDGFATFPKLCERLSKELVQHIEKYIPQLKVYVKKELVQVNAALKRLGNTPPSDKAGIRTFLTDKLSTFTQDVMRLTAGDLLDLTDQQVFSVWRQVVKDTDKLFQSKLELQEQSELSHFEQVIKDQIQLLEEPAAFTLNNFAGKF